MLGSKSGVKRVAVVGLGKKDKDDKELTTAALQAIGAQVSTLRRHIVRTFTSFGVQLCRRRWGHRW